MTDVRDLHKKWLKDPVYRAAYEELGPEFELARAMIEARARAGLTQEQLASRMRTTQSVVARLEGGRVRPSTRTLERFAEATGTRLRIIFEPNSSAFGAE
jgi:transcriptional regulator with XRE-family HTH domain